MLSRSEDRELYLYPMMFLLWVGSRGATAAGRAARRANHFPDVATPADAIGFRCGVRLRAEGWRPARAVVAGRRGRA